MLEHYIYNHKGLYRVGNQLFVNKLEACMALNRLPGEHYLHWDYHEKIFDHYSWQSEPQEDIEELYRQRALQLREQYDHLVLFYSGGADSHTVLSSFIKNNIKLDEIFVWGAFKAEEKVVQKLGMSRTPGYYTREVEMIAKPVLRELQKKHNFKITIWDWTDKTLDILTNPDWFYDVGTRLAPDAIPRQYLHEAFRHNDRFEGRGKKVGFIFGVDKPKLLRDDHHVYFAFLDLMLTTGVGNHSDIHGRTWENDEYFYWSPNFPQIPIKQAHLIFRYLQQQNRLCELVHVNQSSGFHNREYYNMIHPLIYPSWNQSTWQIMKPTSSVVDEVGKWFFDLAPDHSVKRWREGVLATESQIGMRHFNDHTVWNGLIGCYSKLYKIADLPAAAIHDQIRSA